jgi:hypothetical protein
VQADRLYRHMHRSNARPRLPCQSVVGPCTGTRGCDPMGARTRGERLMSGRIPIAGPWITEKEIGYVTQAVTDGWYANSAKYQTEFEDARLHTPHHTPLAGHHQFWYGPWSS